MGYSYEKATEGPHFRRFYARLKKAMSMEDAKAVLGFPPGSSPSPDEIARAYKRKVIENHPDRGGNHEKMVEINVAKDVLDGKQRPTYDRRSPVEDEPGDGPGWSQPWPQPRTPYEPPKRKVVTFEEAAAKAGIPSGVDWVFATETQYDRGGYSSDEFLNTRQAWVAYGRTNSSHVFVGVEHHSYAETYIGGKRDEDEYSIRSYEYPIHGNEGTQPSWLYGNVMKAFKNMQWFSGRWNSKVVDARGKKFDKGMSNGHGASLKHLLVEIGAVADDDPSVANRKQVVEIKQYKQYGFENEKIKPGYYPEAAERYNTYDGKYHGSYYRVVLLLNNKEYELSQKDFHVLCKLALGGKRVRDLLFGDRYYDGKSKNITRMPKGKILLQAFAEKFTDLPDVAKVILEKAAAQMKG